MMTMSLGSRVVAVSILLMLWTAACAPLTPSDTPASATPTELPDETAIASPTISPVPSLGIDPASLVGIEIDTWHAFAGEAQRLFDEQVSLFNAVNEWGIIIRATGFGDYLALDEAMQAGSVEGETPQLLITLPEQALAWQSEGLVVDLGPYLGDPDFGLSVE